MQRILKSAAVGLVVATLLFFAVQALSPGFAAATASTCFVLFGLLVLRPVAHSVARRQEAENTVIVGSHVLAGKLYAGNTDTEPVKVRMAGYSELPGLVRRGIISRVIVADPHIQDRSDEAQALIDLKLRGIRIESMAEAFERTNRKLCVEELCPEGLIFANGFQVSKLYLAAKRVFDIGLSSLLLVITAPLMAVIALAIRLDTRGSVIFSQERVGLLGERFMVHKFRSMREDAEQRTGPVWAQPHDDRITSVGAYLRKWRLDELPQLWNVLRGEMSFIGPRPERPYFVELLKTKLPYFDLRHYVKPGISGWAQVMYPYGASVEDACRKLEYDLYYAKNISVRLDARILLRTIWVVVKGEGR